MLSLPEHCGLARAHFVIMRERLGNAGTELSTVYGSCASLDSRA